MTNLNMNDLESFYFQNIDQLNTHYPGLTLKRLSDEFEDTFDKRAFLDQIKVGVPLEYINQNSYFYRSQFFVDQRVLIPRSESEILVEDVINYINALKVSSLKVAEVGVGSFALGLSVLIDLKIKVNFWGGDISQEALDVAQINLQRCEKEFKATHKITFKLSDRLESAPEMLDVIISNPPYIRDVADREGVHSNVDSYEPHIALYLKDEIYDAWFDSFFRECSIKLKKDGAFFMEGHEDTLESLKLVAQKYFEDVVLKKDYTNRLRFLYAKGIKNG